MVENQCSSFDRSICCSSMNSNNEEKRDVSKVFSLVRAKLNEKEKELLELQRAESSLFAPDQDQVTNLLNVISCLHLSTQDGSFVFPSASQKVSSSSLQSTGIQTIRTLPSNIWLNQRETNDQQDQCPLRLPVVSQLFSMPLKSFVVSPSPSSLASPSTKETAIPSQNETTHHRLPFVNELLSMSLEVFKPSVDHQKTISIQQPSTSIISENSTKIEPMKTILDGESVYSKEFWLKGSSSLTSSSSSTTMSTTTITSSSNESNLFDIEKYIEQTSEKMRRLHSDYVAAINQLQHTNDSPSSSSSSTSNIEHVYPDIFKRIQPSLPNRDRSSASATLK